ncbi:MAG TPA: MBL fold metallo-hydrolase RNA specificity domain-containing protein [Thermoanaerobaculia bacterium]|nr:MBL fold metallo-hydrolase RNA specificity domain-containing protein [Thermoanaerobaculia bacterium]
MRLFQADPDIRLADSEIYLDPAEPRKIGIISHGHSDHIGRHEHFIATAPTAAFLRARSGDDLKGTELSYKSKHAIGEWSVELFPAGHVLGSAMVRVSNGRHSLAYTGDFRLTPSYTAECAEIPEADAVIMESTYGGDERWQFPSREELRERLTGLVNDIIRRDRTPVLLAYSLGKAQETAAMLRGSGVVMHPVVARISAVYERNGIDLGAYEVWGRQESLFGHRSTTDLRGKAVIIPPHMASDIRRVPRRETVALTGWALHGTRDADHGLPLSDHADFRELISFAEQSRAGVIYVTHGSQRFAGELRRRGIRAEFVRKKPQMRLF